MTPLASHGPAPRRRDIRYAALGEDFGEGGLPIQGLGMHCRVADDAVALADGVVEAGQSLAARGGLDREPELADLDGLGVEVHAVEVVLPGRADCQTCATGPLGCRESAADCH
jgi:hypothetical protein